MEYWEVDDAVAAKGVDLFPDQGVSPDYGPGKDLFPGEEPQEIPDIPAWQIPIQAAMHAPASAKKYISDIWTALSDPVETGKALGKVLIGAAQLAIPGDQGYEEHAEAVGQAMKERYGGWKEIKHTMARDPVGFVADASMILTGGGSALGNLPGKAGNIAQKTAQFGKSVDPIAAGAAAYRGGTNVVGGLLTHTGGRSLLEAGESGARGGIPGAGNLNPANYPPWLEGYIKKAQGADPLSGEAFRGTMRETISSSTMVQHARQGLNAMRQARSKAYKEQMKKLKSIEETVDFDKIWEVHDKAVDSYSRKGRVPEALESVMDQVKKKLT